jgi:hypothetical protein
MDLRASPRESYHRPASLTAFTVTMSSTTLPVESPHSSENMSVKNVSPETSFTLYTPDGVAVHTAKNVTPANSDVGPVKSLHWTPVKDSTVVKAQDDQVTISRGLADFSIGFNSLKDPFVDNKNVSVKSLKPNGEDWKNLCPTAQDFLPTPRVISQAAPDIVTSSCYPKVTGKTPPREGAAELPLGQ